MEKEEGEEKKEEEQKQEKKRERKGEGKRKGGKGKGERELPPGEWQCETLKQKEFQKRGGAQEWRASLMAE